MLQTNQDTQNGSYGCRFVIPSGFEPETHSLEGCCSIQLSYGTVRLDSFVGLRPPRNDRVSAWGLLGMTGYRPAASTAFPERECKGKQFFRNNYCTKPAK